MLLGIVCEEYYRTGGCTRRCGQTLDYDLGVLDRLLVEYGVEQLVELGRLAAQYGRLFVDQTVAQHIHGDLDHCGTGTLTVAALQHPELAVLNRELDILHIREVLLQVVLYLVQLGIYLGHDLFQRRILLHAVLLRYVLSLRPAARALYGNLLGGADTCYDILALSVDEILAVEDVLARCGVAGECHAGSRVAAHVTEYHGLHRNGRSPLLRYVVELAVEYCALVHPRAEHGADSAPELIPRIGRELAAGLLLDSLLEVGHQLLQIVGRKLGVEFGAALLLLLVYQHLERIVILLRHGLHAQHYVAVHLYEAAVRVPRETGVA